MKRWPLRILICLILGAITTVAVAWGVALFMPFPGGSEDWSEVGVSVDYAVDDAVIGYAGHLETCDSWPFVIARTIQPPSISARASQMFSAEYARLGMSDWIVAWTTQAYNDPESPRVREVVVERMGIPLPSLWSGWTSELVDQPNFLGNVTVEVTGGIVTPWMKWRFVMDEERVILPLRPIWPGFLIDTLFYAAIWFGVFFGFASAKRLIRIKRGRCPRCGYDLRGQRMKDHGQDARATGCPECGWNRLESSEHSP